MNYRNINNLDELKVLLESNENSKGKFISEEYAPEDENILETEETRIKDTSDSKSEDVEVVYAEEGYNNIFKHIIMFTNNRDPKENKTLANMYEAIDNIKKQGKDAIVPKLHVFVADETDINEFEDGKIKIQDSKNEFILDEESNSDTLVFNRLGAIGEDNCEAAVQILQDRGLLILNPLRGAKLACNKFNTAELLKKGNIPQPNFTLMTKDILYDKKLYKNAMKDIYPDWEEDKEDLAFVVKILDGHGGTGVMLIDNKKLIAVLQCIFAIDPDRKLIIQKKEEADGGDIRVHVLTLRTKQVILAAMKRIKISKDFRSNVSLGATAEPVKLTPEQEQIALKTAKLSTLPWCAVDIMPLVKGSNPEIGDNVVLEINSSPGTEGISEVIDYNFINLLLNTLDNPQEFMLQTKIAGFIESATVDFGKNPVDVLAKLDTGNGAKASHIEVGDYDRDSENVSFSFNGKKYVFEIIGESTAIVGNTKIKRPIIKIPYVKLGRRVLTNVPMAIVKKRDKSTNMLFNRDLLSKFGYAVSSGDKHLLSKEMEKIQVL